jgi:LSD1 subclass zinc finger protein
MSVVQALTCPNCGTHLDPQPGQSEIKCHSCGTVVLVPIQQPQPTPMQSMFPNIVIESMNPISIPIGGGISKAAIIVPIVLVLVILGFVGFIISAVMSQVGQVTNSAFAPFGEVLTSVPQIKTQLLATNTPEPTEQPKPTKAPPTKASLPTPQTFSKVVLKDTLAKQVNGWSVTNENGNTLGFTDGGYEIASTTADNGETTWIKDGYKDVSIEVDVQATAGAGAMGVLCRVKDGVGGYSFEINTDGSYAIYKYTFTSNGANSTGLETGTLPDGLLKTDGLNHLRGDCFGTNLTLVVNGQTVATTVNSAMKSGGFGLLATSSSDSSDGLTVVFKNLVVKSP